MRDLVRTQLNGEIEMGNLTAEDGGGTFAVVTVPESYRRGTAATTL